MSPAKCKTPDCPYDATTPAGYCAPCARAQEPDDEAPVCKIDGCDNPAKSMRGPWRGLCAEHVSAEISRRAAKRQATIAAKAAPSANGTGSLGDRLRDAATVADRIAALEHELDQERAHLAELLAGAV